MSEQEYRVYRGLRYRVKVCPKCKGTKRIRGFVICDDCDEDGRVMSLIPLGRA